MILVVREKAAGDGRERERKSLKNENLIQVLTDKVAPWVGIPHKSTHIRHNTIRVYRSAIGSTLLSFRQSSRVRECLVIISVKSVLTRILGSFSEKSRKCECISSEDKKGTYRVIVELTCSIKAIPS